MIISRTVTRLPLAIAAPTIGMIGAEQHLVRHRRLFDEFLSSLRAASDNPARGASTGTARPSLCIETSRLRLSSTTDASRLSCDDGYSFTTDLAGYLTRADILGGIEQGALAYLASIHSRVMAMNALDCGDLHPTIVIKVLMMAIEQDASAIYLIVLNAAAQNREQR